MVNASESLQRRQRAQAKGAERLGPKGTWPGMGALTSPTADGAPPAYGRDLTYPGTHVERGNPGPLLGGQERKPSGKPMGVREWERRKKPRPPCSGVDTGGHITRPERELTSARCFVARAAVRTEATKGEQMTAAVERQPPGAPSHRRVDGHARDWKAAHRQVHRLQTRIAKAVREQHTDRMAGSPGRTKCSSRRTRTCHVRFLGGWGLVTAPAYPARHQRNAEWPVKATLQGRSFGKSGSRKGGRRGTPVAFPRRWKVL